jgi:adenylosuccinate synthase
MANVVIVGAQWGDEGKAKITDLLAEQAHTIVRSQGGCNAGHTVAAYGHTFKFHLMPSGMLHGGKQCIIGPGTVIYPPVILQEIDDLKTKGFDVKQLTISNRAHVTLPFHMEADTAMEANRDTTHTTRLGTTGKGIGPTYMDKAARFGLRLHELYEPQLKDRLQGLLALKHRQADELDALFTLLTSWAEAMAPYVTDTTTLLHEQATRPQEHILFEGAQGALLDIDHGTYPFVTSSNATAGGACTGSGIGPSRIDCVVGVFKAYITRVGAGPFPSELTDATGDYLVTQGHEFGTTTGRRRRCGWYDAVLARYSARINGLDALAITKLDVLDELAELHIVTGYRLPSGEVLTVFPPSVHTLAAVEPVTECWPGWKSSTRGVTQWAELPAAAQQYLNRLAELTETPIAIVSTGPAREETLFCQNVFAYHRGEYKALTPAG